MRQEEPQVAVGDVMGIANLMDVQSQFQTRAKQGKPLTEDMSVLSKSDLIKGLRAGRIPGDAFLEWKDDKGALRANVIDFLVSPKIKAIDPNSGETVVVETKTLVDGSWKVLH